MRKLNGQTIGRTEERVDKQGGCVVNLTPRVALAEDTADDGALSAASDTVMRVADDESSPIEFITENGFSIIRPWESGKSPGPKDGRCRFGVNDGFIEREVTVEISPGVLTEISLRTRGRIQLSNSFWICCAERHLANHVSEHGDFPEAEQLTVEKLDREDILSALRWGRSDE